MSDMWSIKDRRRLYTAFSIHAVRRRFELSHCSVVSAIVKRDSALSDLVPLRCLCSGSCQLSVYYARLSAYQLAFRRVH